MQFNRFTTKAQEALFKAQEIASSRGQFQVDTIHLLASLIRQEESVIITILNKMEVNTELLKAQAERVIEGQEKKQSNVPFGQVYVTQELARVFEKSVQIAAALKDEFISTEHLFLALVEVESKTQAILADFGIS